MGTGRARACLGNGPSKRRQSISRVRDFCARPPELKWPGATTRHPPHPDNLQPHTHINRSSPTHRNSPKPGVTRAHPHPPPLAAAISRRNGWGQVGASYTQQEDISQVCRAAPYLEAQHLPTPPVRPAPGLPRQLSLQKTAALGTQQSNSNPRHADTAQLKSQG